MEYPSFKFIFPSESKSLEVDEIVLIPCRYCTWSAKVGVLYMHIQEDFGGMI